MKAFVIVSGIVCAFYMAVAGVSMLAPNSRMESRLTGSELRLELPKDFERPSSFTTGRSGEKDLFYVDKEGVFKVKTYTDWGMLESEIVFVK